MIFSSMSLRRVASGAARPCPAPVHRHMAQRKVIVHADPKDQLASASKAAQDLLSKSLGAIGSIDATKAKEMAVGVKDQAVSTYNFSVSAVKGCIDAAMGVWDKYDTDKDGKLSMDEALALINSEEVAAAVKQGTGMDHTTRTAADIQTWFKRADFDKSGTLSKREFTVLYVGLMAHKAKLGVQGLAAAVCTALDNDGDGKIGSTELKALLEGSPLKMLANTIPDGKEVDYRKILGMSKA